ncbi:MAG TPA: SRPBCC family protein [Trebonia sp.]
MTEPDLRLRAVVPAPLEVVYQALTDPAALRVWLADSAGARGALQTFWSLSIANLADYLAGRELTPKCDFTSNELRASVVIDAAPEQVFDSMTQPEQFRRWFGANVGIEPRVGGRFAMGGFELDPAGQVRRVRAGPKGDPAVRRRHDR